MEEFLLQNAWLKSNRNLNFLYSKAASALYTTEADANTKTSTMTGLTSAAASVVTARTRFSAKIFDSHIT